MTSKDQIARILFITALLLLVYIGYMKMQSNAADHKVAVVEQQVNTSSLLTKEDVSQLVKEYILENPEVIIQSVEMMHKRKMSEMEHKISSAIKESQAELENPLYSPIAGNPNGDISVVMFYDYKCNYCKKANSVVNELLAGDANVKLIYKPHPILGQESGYLSQMALAVYKVAPAKFAKIHEALMSKNISSHQDMATILAEHDLNILDIEKEFESDEVKSMQTKIAEVASKLNIQGAPAFVIDGTIFPGLLELDRMKSVIDAARSSNKKPAAVAPTAPAAAPSIQPSENPATAPETPTAAPTTQDAAPAPTVAPTTDATPTNK